MATVRTHFDTDFSDYILMEREWSFSGVGSEGNASYVVPFKLCQDLLTGAQHLTFYIPDCRHLPALVIAAIGHVAPTLEDMQKVYIEPHSPGEKVAGPFQRVFTQGVTIYADGVLPANVLVAAQTRAKELNLRVAIRDRTWAAQRSAAESPLAFLCHDSRDKDAVARPLAQALVKLACPAWYDEFSLRIGDNLRTSIEAGIKGAKKCVLILSKNFFANGGWTKTEFESIFQKGLIEGSSATLPIWVGVTKEEVYEYSPSLVGCFALHWAKDEAERIAAQIRPVLFSKK